MGRKLVSRTQDGNFSGNTRVTKERKLSLAAKQKYPQSEKSGAFWFKYELEPRSGGQEYYVNVINESDITLCIGPAGCGKTWIVTRLALEALAKNRVSKIVVTKPIIEAGSEKLGALPGEVEDKVLPHFMSILDCFEDHVGPTVLKQLLDSKKIVFLPIAYARGRDLKYSFIIADEAQNLTKKGIKLLMTRISEGSTMVLNGDGEQIDLPNEADSGLAWAASRLIGKNPRIGVVKLDTSDVQRHPLTATLLDNLR